MDDRGILVSFLYGIKTLRPALRPAQSRIQRVKEDRGGRGVKPTIYECIYIYICGSNSKIKERVDLY